VVEGVEVKMHLIKLDQVVDQVAVDKVPMEQQVQVVQEIIHQLVHLKVRVVEVGMVVQMDLVVEQVEQVDLVVLHLFLKVEQVVMELQLQ
tara:strand:- start:58 stop:327 length:270 start_codon:yes stop_codon:yes gene_type:complete